MRYAPVLQPKWMCSLLKCFYQIKNIEYKISHIQVGMTIKVEVGTVKCSWKLNKGSRDRIYRIETGKGRGIRPSAAITFYFVLTDLLVAAGSLGVEGRKGIVTRSWLGAWRTQVRVFGCWKLLVTDCHSTTAPMAQPHAYSTGEHCKTLVKIHLAKVLFRSQICQISSQSAFVRLALDSVLQQLSHMWLLTHGHCWTTPAPITASLEVLQLQQTLWQAC